MKELWTANPFHLMNRPFAEMGYNSSGLNIAPERLLLATRRPFTHHPIASSAPSFDPLRATCRRVTNHLNTRHNIWRPPQAICRRSAQHLAAPCTASVGSLHAICPPVHRAIPASPSQAICRRSAQHLATPCKPSAIARHSILRPPRVIRWHPADICRHEPMPLTTRKTSRRREQEP